MKKTIEVPWKASQAIGVFLASWVGVPLAAVLLLDLTGIFSPQARVILNRLSNNDVTVSFILVLIGALVGLWLVKQVLNRYHLGWEAVGLRKVSWGRAILYFLAVLLAFLLLISLAFALITWLFPHFNANQPQVNEFTNPNSAGTVRISFLALVVIPPLIEETIFRGFIFPALTKRWGIIGGAIITSMLFAVAHWQLNVSVYTLILSLLLCFMYYKLRSLWPGILLHMINNAIAFAALIKK